MALLELLLALLLVGGAIISAGPILTQTARILSQGRVLLEGTSLAVEAKERLLLGSPGPCNGPRTGRDSGQFAVAEWAASPGPVGDEFLARIVDPAGRFPPESLAALVPCRP